MSRQLWVLGCAVVLAAVLAPAATAVAKTYRVAGRQIVKDEEAGAYVMRGGLLGRWNITSFKEDTDPDTPLQGTGTEKFRGCLNLHRGRRCKGDPKGTLEFSFEYWAEFDGEALVWGACYHPITKGTGAFEGARGVLTMVDSPTANGVNTRYVGTITLGDEATARGAKVRKAC